MSQPTFRLVREGDEANLLALLQAAFGRWPAVDAPVAPIEHLRWKLAAAPPADRYHCVAQVDGRLVAAHLAVLHRFRARYGTAVALRTWDAAVHPDEQGRGLMRELRRFLLEQARPHADFETGAFTRNAAMSRLLDEAGQVPLGARMETAIAPLTLPAAIATLKLSPRRAPAKLVRAAALLARWAQSRPARPVDGFAIRTVQRFDGRIAAFVEEASEPFDLLIERTPEFLRWRYEDERGGRFTIALAEEGDRLLGYAVQRMTRGRAYLADLLALPGRPDAVEALARHAAASFRRQGAATVECLIAADHPYRAILSRCGFVGRRRRKDLFAIVPLRASPGQLAFLQRPGLRLHLMLGDSDTV